MHMSMRFPIGKWTNGLRASWSATNGTASAVIRKSDGAFLGQCGLTMQPFGERLVPEVGYLLARRYWRNGYATEAAAACRSYAFEELGFPEVYSIIRENNLPSRRVAERGGMQIVGTIVKHYYGFEMPHLVYCLQKSEP